MRLKLVPVSPYRKNISLRRVWSHLRYARGIARQAEAHVAAHGKPDVILFSVPPMEAGSVALKLGRKYGAKVLLDVMDAWPEALLRLPMAAIAQGEGRRGQGSGKILSSWLRHLRTSASSVESQTFVLRDHSSHAQRVNL